jgi:hypothetical protein
MSRRMNLLERLCKSLLAIAVIDACGPPLTQPSSLDISGRWATTDAIGPLSDVEMSITQRPDGTVSGQWSANMVPENAPCPPGLGPNPTGLVNGTNTVLEVRLALLGAGDFDGQAIDSRTLKGSFVSCSSTYAIVFSFAGPLPPP